MTTRPSLVAALLAIACGCSPAAFPPTTGAPSATGPSPIVSAQPTLAAGTASIDATGPSPTRFAPTATPAESPSAGARPDTAIAMMFDDFAYADRHEMAAAGWTLRTTPGWPGLAGATWSAESISMVDDPERAGDRLVRLTSSTDGTPEGTTQAQICHERKYRDGTYATRMRFTDGPVAGPDGDVVIESFYAITPYEEPLDPAYSELDFEFLPNGGWGEPPAMWVNSWETVRIEPWLADNAPDASVGDFTGWHTLVMKASDGSIAYYLDGEPLATHGEHYYPESPMSINHNLWFFADGLIASREERTYVDEIDWTFHAAGQAVSPEAVETLVAELRAAGTTAIDTVPDWSPPQESPCDL